LVSAALALALALPSPAYAMRAVNAGQEEATQRAIRTGLEQAATQGQAVGTPDRIIVDPVEWEATEARLWFLMETAHNREIILRTRDEAGPEPEAVRTLIEAIRRYGQQTVQRVRDLGQNSSPSSSESRLACGGPSPGCLKNSKTHY